MASTHIHGLITFLIISKGIQDVIAQYAITPAEDYFNGFVLGYTKGSSGESHSWYDFGKLQWQPALCMLLTWLVMLMILFKGLKVYGKIAYFMTLLPYFVLTAFLIYGLTLEGSKKGIDYFITPDWDLMLVSSNGCYRS